MGFDVEGKDLQDVRVIKCYSEIGETIKVDWSVAQTGSHGSLEAIIKSNMTSVSKGHED